MRPSARVTARPICPARDTASRLCCREGADCPPQNAIADRAGFPFPNVFDGTPLSVPRRSLRRRPGEGSLRGREPMVNATEYRAMAAEHHRLAGMCRSPESRERHFRLEQELRALAEREEVFQGTRAPHHASDPQIVK